MPLSNPRGTTRSIATMVLCAALTLVTLVACGGGSSPTTPPSPTTSSAQATATGSAGATATVTATGTQTVPAGTPVTPSPSPSVITQASPPASAAGEPGGSPVYLDDRSSADTVIRSFYNAVDRKEYARAYSYWEPASASAQLPPFPQFQQGYADTERVDVSVGQTGVNPGAGQLYYAVPVVLMSHLTGGPIQTFSGCYVLHLARPEIQTAPPFHPMAIQSATLIQAPSTSDPQALLASGCTGPNAPSSSGEVATPTSAPTAIGAARYLDDRSSAVEVVRSYYNAINRKEYARAYGYWESGAATSQLRPFDQFRQGYAATASVDLTTGAVTSDVGAGQLYFAVPVILTATNTDGSTQVFVGCYRLHLGQPAIQAAPPFQPMAIQSASVSKVDNGANVATQMSQACR